MVHHADRSKLPPDFTELPLESALRVLLQAHLFDVETLTELEAKHRALIEYIESIIKGEENGSD